MRVQVFFVYPYNEVGKAINWFQRLKSGHSDSCHCGFIIDGEAYEALVFGGVTKRDFALAYAGKRVEVFDVLEPALPNLNRVRLRVALELLLGTFRGAYGIAKIPLQATDAVLSFVARRPVFFATRLSIEKFFICVGLVTYHLYKYGTPELGGLLKKWRGMSVDDFKDFVLLHTEYFKKGEIWR